MTSRVISMPVATRRTRRNLAKCGIASGTAAVIAAMLVLDSAAGKAVSEDAPGAPPKFEPFTNDASPERIVPRIGIGGEDFASATAIASLPYEDTGNTCGAVDDYDPTCAATNNSNAPDLVYVFQPATEVCIDIDLCGSNYDTAVQVYENDLATPIACSDDHCGLQSRIAGLHLTAGNDYYIVVDGWSSSCGDYALRVTTTDPTLSGWVNYYAPTPLPNTNHVPGVEVCLDVPSPGICGTSDPSGGYKITGSVAGAASLDATKSPTAPDHGAIGGGDIQALLEFLNGGGTLSPEQQIAADVDGSGTPPDVTDLQQLRRFLVFDFASCPGCALWKFSCDPAGTPVDAPCSVILPTCTNATVDLRGLLVGDIDSSWPTRSKVQELSPPGIAFGNAAWNASTLMLPVTAQAGESPLRSLLFSLNYDANVMVFTGAELGPAAAAGHLTLNAQHPGVVHGLWSGLARPRSASETLLEFDFQARDADSQSRFSFSRLYINDQDSQQRLEILVSRHGQTESLPQRFALSAAPNPFNPSTRIDYSIPEGMASVSVEMRVLDLTGRLVRILLQTDRAAGRYRQIWDGRSTRGDILASGVYLIQLRAGSLVSTQKVVLLK